MDTWPREEQSGQICRPADGVFVRLYSHGDDPCLHSLRYRCHRRTGFLFHLSEFLTARSLHIEDLDVRSDGAFVDSSMTLRTPKPPDLADVRTWCLELEEQATEQGAPKGLEQPAAAASRRLSVNLDLLSITAFESLEASDVRGNLAAEFRYRLEFRGISQGGLLAYTSFVFFRSGLQIVRARVVTLAGCVTGTFELSAKSQKAERMLCAFLQIQARADDESSLLWDDICWPPTAMPDSQPTSTSIVLSNGDKYEGELALSEDGIQQRHGFGCYTYSSRSHSEYKEFQGQWLNDEKHGHGMLLSCNGSVYAGQWQQNQRHGLGVVFENNAANGDIKSTMPSYRYEGQWEDDQQHGLGVEQDENSVYFGKFEFGLPHGNGLRVSLQQLGVPGSDVLFDASWRPLSEVLEGSDVKNEGGMTKVQSSSSKSFLSRSNVSVVGAQSGGRRSMKSSLNGYSKGTPAPIGFERMPVHGDHRGVLPDGDVSAALGNQDGLRIPVDNIAEQIERQALHWRNVADSSHSEIVESGFNRLRPHSIDTRRDCSNNDSRWHTPPSSTSAKGWLRGSPDSVGASSCYSADPARIQGSKAAGSGVLTPARSSRPRTPSGPDLSPERGHLGCEEGRQERRQSHMEGRQEESIRAALFASPNCAALVTPPQSFVKPRAAPDGRRAHTPGAETRRKRNGGIFCPMLWGHEELATFVRCLGLSDAVAEQVRRRRLKGADQLLEMSNAEMRSELGLSSQLECLLLRRALQRMLEMDRLANSSQGHSIRDVLSDTVLNAHIVPLDELSLRGRISQGGYGTVHRGFLKGSSGKGDLGHGHPYVAVKEMMGVRRVQLYELLKEARVMQSLRHPNICSFVGVCADKNPKGKRYIISELMDCALYDLVHRPTSLRRSVAMTPLLATELACGIAAGVAHIHDMSLVHADIKSSNVLIAMPSSRFDLPTPRICDFGHAAVRPFPAPHTRLGTPHWAAPEVLRGEALGPAADVFSVGVVVWEMLVRRPPHEGFSLAQVLAAVGWAGRVPDLKQLPEVPADFRRVLRECFSFWPRGRPTPLDMRRRLKHGSRAVRAEALAMLSDFLGN